MKIKNSHSFETYIVALEGFDQDVTSKKKKSFY